MGVRVELEVDEPHGEDKHITFVEHLGEELVFVGGGLVGCHKANVQCSLEHREDLSGARVRMWWVLTQGSIVDARN